MAELLSLVESAAPTKNAPLPLGWFISDPQPPRRVELLGQLGK